MAAQIPDYEQAGELKFGQVGIANLRIRNLDVEKLKIEMQERVARAPKLFVRAAVILDFGGLSKCPDAKTVNELIDSLKSAGVLPIAIAYGTSAIEELSVQVGLPLLAKFRVSYESQASADPEPQAKKPARKAEPEMERPTPVVVPAKSEPGIMHTQPVRSGQQIYAQNKDITVMATVGAGAEVIADGSIHIYGALRGRALAGASDNVNARIFCREFHAELVAIAGHYKVLEEIPKNLLGKAVQIFLEKDQLRIEELT
ncbi:MAG TPA: septum site-determining protein MinC [Arenimonas sp.]|nr:septum site-determining protein MinC [Arenimonas sp.]